MLRDNQLAHLQELAAVRAMLLRALELDCFEAPAQRAEVVAEATRRAAMLTGRPLIVS